MFLDAVVRLVEDEEADVAPEGDVPVAEGVEEDLLSYIPITLDRIPKGELWEMEVEQR